MAANSPPNPKDIQVVGPEEKVTQPAPVPVDPGPPEDRILTPAETEQFFRTGTFKAPEDKAAPVEPDGPIEVEQRKSAQEFFATPTAMQEPARPPAAAELTKEQKDAAVAASQQPTQLPLPGIAPAAAPQGPVVVPLPGTPVAPQPAQQTPQEIALQAQVQTLSQQMAGLTSQIQQQQATTQLQQAQTQAQVPAFNMQVPAQHMTALASEDAATRTAAMNDIINGVAHVVHAQTIAEVEKRIEAMTPQMQQQVQAATAAQDIKRDMYGTYPELNAMPDQVVAVANQMSNAGMFPEGWGPRFRDAIAERLAPLVPGLAEKVQLNRSVGLVPQQQVPQQNLPQVQQLPAVLPPGVAPAQVIGGVHVPVPQQGPMLVRDALGNLSQVFPQQAQQVVGSQVRPGGVSQGDASLQDIWSTLGYPT